MAAGAGDMANSRAAAPGSQTQGTPGGDAYPKGGDAARSDTPLDSRDRTFVHTTAGLNLYEMAAAQLGAQRAQNPAVRSYAERLQRDHARSHRELQELAQRHRIELPQQMPPDRQRVIERLEHSASFDTAFVNTVGVQDHHSTIERYEKAARDTRDPELKRWIDQQLPSLREHLAQARKLPGANAEAEGR